MISLKYTDDYYRNIRPVLYTILCLQKSKKSNSQVLHTLGELLFNREPVLKNQLIHELRRHAERREPGSPKTAHRSANKVSGTVFEMSKIRNRKARSMKLVLMGKEFELEEPLQPGTTRMMGWRFISSIMILIISESTPEPWEGCPKLRMTPFSTAFNPRIY
jgi:hypothetical protein